MAKASSNVKGILFLVAAVFTISIQNIVIKWISGDYSAIEIVAIRSLIAFPATILLYRYEGKKGLPKTDDLKGQYLRGVYMFLSYTTFMMGLASLMLADVEGIKYSGPLMITGLSVVLLGEKVGPRRWLALAVGFIGVLMIVKPWSANFNIGSIFVLISVFLYAMVAIQTRRIQHHSSSATMAYFSSQFYLFAIVLFAPLPIIFGNIPNPHPSVAFLLRPWVMPSMFDLMLMMGLGVVFTIWMYLMARAYSLARASVAAPFEYVSLPINLVWGFLIWGEIPTWLTLGGAALTLASGLYVLYREKQERAELAVVDAV